MPTMKELLEANTAFGQRRIAQVFQDFCELSALAIRNAVDLRGCDTRETRYLTIATTYEAKEMTRFAKALAQLVQTLEAGLTDVLGHLYMTLEIGNERLGQFFTPFDISLVAARIMTDGVAERLQQQKFVTVSEPTCGSGGMVIAVAQIVRDAGFNYQRSLHVTAQDISATAVHMAYTQLSLLHVPALVVHGDVLALEKHDVWPTPAHVLGRWDARLRGSAACRSTNPTDETQDAKLP